MSFFFLGIINIQLHFAGCKSVGEQVLKMREAVKQLPPSHSNSLKYVIEHLNRFVHDLLL